MQVTCPECGKKINAKNINVQEMVAVCDSCSYVFRFDVTEENRKRRKLKKPPRLTLSETADQFSMRYQMVSNEHEVSLTIGNAPFALLLPFAVIFSFMYRMPLIVPLFFALWSAASWYVQSAIWFNKTTISIDDTHLTIENGPIPWITAVRGRINRQDIVEVVCVETEQSQASTAMTRYFHVQVKLRDDHKTTILKALPQDYAFYIAQQLNAEIENDPHQDSPTRLKDLFEDDDDHTTNGHNTASTNRVN